MTDRPPQDKPTWVRYSGVGIEFVAAVACFALIGYWVDRRWDTGPWGVVIGAALGLIGGTYNLIRESMAAFRRFEKRSKDEPRDDQPK
jgi:ATP synthase protein I